MQTAPDPPVADWDDAYANADHIPGADALLARWQADAPAFRAEVGAQGRARLDLAYGPGPRERLDLFLPEGAPRGLCVFVHGGYWKAFDKSAWSWLAAGPLARGWAVALPSYPLCPDARIRDIAACVARAVAAAAEEVEGPIALTGHSAGGHLVARMICAGGPLPPDVRARVRRVIGISGLYDLRPLMRTTMNGTLRIDAAEAAAESPALLAPDADAAITCWVGAAERPEFLRQNALLANVWRGLGAATNVVETPGEHHFNVIDGLADPDAPLCAALLGD